MVDEHLIRRAQGGDKAALDSLIRRYYDNIYSYCFHHAGEKQTAEDLCQETFLSMLAHIEEYRHYDKFQNYLYVIAGNKCKDFYKKKKSLCYDEIFTSKERHENNEEALFIKELVHKLPHDLREIIILRFYQDLKYKDIAKILNISISLAKYRTQKAIAMLREEVERSLE